MFVSRVDIRLSLLLLLLLAAVAASAPVDYVFNVKCNGLLPLLVPSTCLTPEGNATVADTVTFPAGTNVTIGTSIQGTSYTPLIANSITIDAGADVTLANGMFGVKRDMYVKGTLHLGSPDPDQYWYQGAGPSDDGVVQPLPNYQMSGFTPNIIGNASNWFELSTESQQSTMYVSGTVIANSAYPTSFVNVVIEMSGTYRASQSDVWSHAFFFGTVRNYGVFQMGNLYMVGTFINEVSGVLDDVYIQMSPGGLGWPTVINMGSMGLGIRSSDGIVQAHIENHGTLALKAQRQPLNAEVTEVRFLGTVKNFGSIVLDSFKGRINRYHFAAAVVNAGEIRVENAGLLFAGDVENTAKGTVHAQNTVAAAANAKRTPSTLLLSVTGRFDNAGALVVRGFLSATLLGAVANSGSMHVEHAEQVNVLGAFANAGALHVAATQQVNLLAEVHNTGSVTVEHTGSNIVACHRDVFNLGSLTIGATETTFKQDLYNAGTFALTDTLTKRSRCFVDGQTIGTGNISVANAHLTVAKIIQAGGTHIRLSTPAATFTLGAWGTSLQRGVARGYLQRETAAEAAALLPAKQPEAAAHASGVVQADQSVDACGAGSCEACCAESIVCMVYWEWAYCNGYYSQDPQLQDSEHPHKAPQQRFMLSPATVARLPQSMRGAFAGVKFQHAHVFLGDVAIAGPGAVTTIDTLEVQGHLQMQDGAEVFAMVEHGRAVAHGPGHITVQHSAKFHMGNDVVQTLAGANVTVAAGGALVVPRHAQVHLAAGHIHVHAGGRLHVDGVLTTGGHFALHAADGFRFHGKGEVTKK